MFVCFLLLTRLVVFLVLLFRKLKITWFAIITLWHPSSPLHTDYIIVNYSVPFAQTCSQVFTN